MIKSFLVATTALALMAGAALAQPATMSTTTTRTTTSDPAPMAGVASDSSSQRTVDSNGVVIDKSHTYTTGTAVTPYGDLATTRRTTETTTTH